MMRGVSVKIAPILLILLAAMAGRAQVVDQPVGHRFLRRYVVLDSVVGPVHRVRAHRGVGSQGQQLEVFNVMVPPSLVQGLAQDLSHPSRCAGDELLIAMAILPNLATGNITWQPIALDSLAASQRLLLSVLQKECVQQVYRYKERGSPPMYSESRRMDVVPIVYQQGRYWTVSNPVLTEYFLLRNKPAEPAEKSDYVTLNMSAPLFTKADFHRKAQLSTAHQTTNYAYLALRGQLTSKYFLNNKTGDTHEFWSLPPIISDGRFAYSGSGEILFKPHIGVLSGKYSDYFGLSEENPRNTFFTVIAIDSIIPSEKR